MISCLRAHPALHRVLHRPRGLPPLGRGAGRDVYEAVSLAITAFQQHGCAPGATALLEIEVRGPAVSHALNMLKIREWASASAKTPKEKLIKERLKELLAAK